MAGAEVYGEGLVELYASTTVILWPEACHWFAPIQEST